MSLLTGFVDSLSVGYLLVFAIALRTIAQRLPQTERGFLAPVLGAVAMTVYFAEHAAIDGHDFDELVISVIRTICVYQIATGLVTVFLALGLWIGPRRRGLMTQWRRRRQAKVANGEFEAERQLLQRLSLDDDEREVLLLQAKQRFLEKLSQLPGGSDASERQ